MKIVIDSSVWIAGIGSKTGYASQAIYRCFTDSNIELIISDQILAEVLLNLQKKLKFDSKTASEATAIIKNLCDFSITITNTEEKSVKVIEYRPDKYILALAKKTKANFLITFDRKHLLPLEKFGKVKIVEPREFIERTG